MGSEHTHAQTQARARARTRPRMSEQRKGGRLGGWKGGGQGSGGDAGGRGGGDLAKTEVSEFETLAFSPPPFPPFGVETCSRVCTVFV